VDAIGEGEHADLLAKEALFNEHLVTRRAKDLLLHGLSQSLKGLIAGLAHRDALPRSQAVCLHNSGHGHMLNIMNSFLVAGKELCLAGRDVVFQHQIFGEGFRSLNPGSSLRGAGNSQTF
jgi:hypothetical protein